MKMSESKVERALEITMNVLFYGLVSFGAIAATILAVGMSQL